MITDIQAIVAQLTGQPKFYFGSWNKINSDLEQGNFPGVALLPMQTGKFTVAAGAIQKEQPQYVAFFDKSSMTATPETIEAIIESMKDLAAEFVKYYNQSRVFWPIDEATIETIYPNKLDNAVCGCILNFTSKPMTLYGC